MARVHANPTQHHSSLCRTCTAAGPNQVHHSHGLHSTCADLHQSLHLKAVILAFYMLLHGAAPCDHACLHRYKEARSAQQRERLRTRGRPLALRAPKTRQRQLKVQRRGRGPSFRDAAENLLNEIAGRPDKARGAGREVEGAGSPKQPGGRQQSRADRPGEPRERAWDVRGENEEEWRGAGAAGERPMQGARRQQGDGMDGAQGLGVRGASSGPGARRAGGVSKAEMTARLLMARKPSAPVFPMKQGPSKKAKKAAALAAASFKGAAQG